MSDDLEKLYLLYWSVDTRMQYTPGSIVSYLPDGRVDFANPLIYPGGAIFTWANRKPGRRPGIQLPLLEHGALYEYRIIADETPEKSLGMSVTMFDEFNEQLDVAVSDELEGIFTYADDARDYKMQLMSFNNQKMRFDHVLLGLQETVATYDVDIDTKNRLLVVHHSGIQPGPPLNIVFVRQQRPIMPLYFNRAGTTVFFAPNGIDLSDDAHYTAYIEHASAWLKEKFDEQARLTMTIATRDAELFAMAEKLKREFE